MTRSNRNELCPCGSGKKAKKCCGAAASTPVSRGVLLALAPVALLAGLGIYAAISGNDAPEPAAAAASAAAPAPAPVATTSAAPATQPAAAQPGPAPAGKVWSPEHGHWHDANAAASPVKIDMNLGNAAVATENGAIRIDGKALEAAAKEMRLPGQPDGPAPEGKVWSTEHQHWHDKPTTPPPTVHLGTVNRPGEPVPPPGPAPAGMVWSPEHGHWHKAPPVPAAPAPTTTTP